MNLRQLEHQLAVALCAKDSTRANQLAEHIVRNYAYPSQDALALAGPRPGWKHVANTHALRG